METWLVALLVVTAVALLVSYARRGDRRRERAEFETPDDIFDAPAGRATSASGRGSRKADPDRNDDNSQDGGDGGDGGGGGGD